MLVVFIRERVIDQTIERFIAKHPAEISEHESIACLSQGFIFVRVVIERQFNKAFPGWLLNVGFEGCGTASNCVLRGAWAVHNRSVRSLRRVGLLLLPARYSRIHAGQ